MKKKKISFKNFQVGNINVSFTDEHSKAIALAEACDKRDKASKKRRYKDSNNPIPTYYIVTRKRAKEMGLI